MSKDGSTRKAPSVQALLEESVARIDGRTRSRLTQARHAAIEAAGEPRRLRWLRAGWPRLRALPLTGAVAAALVAVIVLGYLPGHRVGGPQSAPTVASAPAPLEVMDMLADDEGMSLMEDSDHSFYEWAADQGENDDSGAKAQS